MVEEMELLPDTPIAEVGRYLMAAWLGMIQSQETILCAEADVTAVHEMRKAIRRMFTLFKLFRPYFEAGCLEEYRRPLRKMMRLLAPARDTAVFLIKLRQHMAETGDESLAELEAYWQARQTAVDDQLIHYLNKPKRELFWRAYGAFTHTPGMGAIPLQAPATPIAACHLIPILIYQRLAEVRAFENHLGDAPLERMHRLRIQFKELRYTLQFFAPLLGEPITDVINTVKPAQEHLGDLNDARIALRMLEQVEGLETAVATYHAVKEAEIRQLVNDFPALWDAFDAPQWRQALAMAIAVL